MDLQLLLLTAIALLLMLIGLCALIFHKLTNAHLLSFEIKEKLSRTAGIDLQNLLKQLQCLDRLCKRLGLEKGDLPPAAGWTALPDVLLELEAEVRKGEVETVVECGSGLSTLVFAKAFSNSGKGKVYSLEHDAECAEKTREELEALGLSTWAEVIDAPLKQQKTGNRTNNWYSEDSLKKIESDKIDLLFVDGPPVNSSTLARYPALPAFSAKLENSPKKGLRVVLDDGIRQDEQEIKKLWLKENNNLSEKRVFTERGAIFLHRK